MSDDDDEYANYAPRNAESMATLQLADVARDRFNLAKDNLTVAHEVYQKEKKRYESLLEVNFKFKYFFKIFYILFKAIADDLHRRACPDMSARDRQQAPKARLGRVELDDRHLIRIKVPGANFQKKATRKS